MSDSRTPNSASIESLISTPSIRSLTLNHRTIAVYLREWCLYDCKKILIELIHGVISLTDATSYDKKDSLPGKC